MGMLAASIISDTLVAIAIPLYFILMTACIKYRHQHPFCSSFFALTFSQGVADLMMIATILILLKPPLYYGIFIDVYLSYPLLFGRLQAFFSMALGCSQHISLLSVALNRFTAVCMPAQHNTIWKQRTTIAAVVAQWLIPLLLQLPILTTDIRYISQNNGSCLGSSCLGIVWGNVNMVSFYYMTSLAYICAIVIVCGVLYTLQFRAIWKQRTTHGMLSNHTRVELRLALMGAIIFVISLSYLFFLITSIVAPSVTHAAQDMVWLYFLTTVIMSSVNPFILIGMSKQVRLKCWNLLCGQRMSDHHDFENSTRGRRTILK